nr:hypothetical protein GCM10020093_094170 [Planobispora longispora]
MVTGRPPRTVAAALALAVTVPMLSACFAEPSPHEAVRDFLVGWQTGDYATAARRTDGDEQQVRRALEDAKIQLDAASFRFALKGSGAWESGSRPTSPPRSTWGEQPPVGVRRQAPLHLVNGSWKVRWSPSVLHPSCATGSASR